MLILHSSHPVNPPDPNLPHSQHPPHTQQKHGRGRPHRISSRIGSRRGAWKRNSHSLGRRDAARSHILRTGTRHADVTGTKGRRRLLPLSLSSERANAGNTHTMSRSCCLKEGHKQAVDAEATRSASVAPTQQQTDRQRMPLACVCAHLVLLCGRSSIRVVRHHCFVSVQCW